MASTHGYFCMLFSFVIAGVGARQAKNFDEHGLKTNGKILLLFSFVIAGVAVRPAQNFNAHVLESRGEKEDKVGASHEIVSDPKAHPQSQSRRHPHQGDLPAEIKELESDRSVEKASYSTDIAGWHKWESDQKQKWAAFERASVPLDEIAPGHFDVQMPDPELGTNVVDATEMFVKEQKLYVESMAASNAKQDVVGLWHLKSRSRSATFSIQYKGAELLMTQTRDDKILESPLRSSGEWWQGRGDFSTIGGGSNDVIRVRRRGGTLLCNTKGPDDWRWRETVVAFKDGDDSADCDGIVGSDSKINLAVAKRCLDKTGFVHIHLPKGEHSIDDAFFLKSDGTVLLQGDEDKADAVLKCSNAHPAFEFNDGAELIIEGLVVDSCGASTSAAILAEGKDNVSLRLQRGAVIRSAVGHGICIRGSSRNSNIQMEDDSTISDSGLNGVFVEGGERNTLSLRSSTITGSAKNGTFAQGGTHNMFFLENSTINGSGQDGICAYKGEEHAFSLWYSTIKGSGEDGIYAFEGQAHTFSLGYSTINGSVDTGFEVDRGRNHAFNLWHSTILDSFEDGLYAYGGIAHTFRLGHSAIKGSRSKGIYAFNGSYHTFSLENSTIIGSGVTGVDATEGENHTFSLRYATIADSATAGLYAKGGRNHTFRLWHSVIDANGKEGLCVYQGKKHTLSLSYCTISANTKNGVYVFDGDRHTFSLGYCTIKANTESGLHIFGGSNYTVSVTYSTIDANGHSGIDTNYVKHVSLRLWHSIIKRSNRSGLFVHAGSANAVSLSHCTINDNAACGIHLSDGLRHSLTLGYSTIDGNAKHGIKVYGWQSVRGSLGVKDDIGRKNTVRLWRSTINGSGLYGLLAGYGDSNTFLLWYSTINASGLDNICVREGLGHAFSLWHSTISAAGQNGLYAQDGGKHTFSVGSSTIEGSGHSGLYAFQGRHHTFSLWHLTILGSAKNGLHVSEGRHHTFSLGYSMINGSGANGLWVTRGEAYSLNLWYSAIVASAKQGLWGTGGKKHTFSLGHSTISDCGQDCLYAEGSILIGGCTFERCGGHAVATLGCGCPLPRNLLIMDTTVNESETGVSVRAYQGSNVTIKNTSFWKIAGDAVSVSRGSLHTTNVSVYASGVAFRVAKIHWEGSDSTIMGNGKGIICTGGARGSLTTSFVYLNGLRDIDNCDGLILDAPLPIRVHADTLQMYVLITLLVVMALTVVLPIIQDPPREFHECSWFLMFLSIFTAATWLSTITGVLWTVYQLFQRKEVDEKKYGTDAWAWAMQFILILVMGIIATLVAIIVAFFGRKKISFLRSTAQTILDSDQRRKCQQDLAHKRSDYSKKLKECHETMVKHVSCATCCKSIDEGKRYLMAAQDQFDQMKKLAKENGKELDSTLARDVQQTYKEDTLRWRALLDIESLTHKSKHQGEHMIPVSKINAGKLTRINAEEQNDEVTRHLLLAASWGRSVFQTSLENIAARLNSNDHVNDLIDELSEQLPPVAEQLKTLIPEVRNLKDTRYKLLRDVHATLAGKHCNVIMGPNKTYESASRKAASLHDELKDAPEWQMPAARHLLDLLRATVVFSDPIALIVYLNLLATEFTVVSTKNKYKEPLEKVGSPSILVNIEIDTILGKLTGEVQLYLDKFLDLKSMAHTNYEVDRVRELPELLLPFEH